MTEQDILMNEEIHKSLLFNKSHNIMLSKPQGVMAVSEAEGLIKLAFQEGAKSEREKVLKEVEKLQDSKLEYHSLSVCCFIEELKQELSKLHNPKEQNISKTCDEELDTVKFQSVPADTNNGCGKYLGYIHTSGAKAYCGDDVVTHIVYCNKCKKKQLSKLGEKQ